MKQLFGLLKTEPSLRQLFRHVLRESALPTKEMLASLPTYILGNPTLRETLVKSLIFLCYAPKSKTCFISPVPAIFDQSADDNTAEDKEQQEEKLIPLLNREEITHLFKELEKIRAVLQRIIASHAAGIAEIIRRGKVVLVQEESIQNFVMVASVDGEEELSRWRIIVKSVVERLEYIEEKIIIRGRDSYLDEIVSLLTDLSLERGVEESALDAIEVDLTNKSARMGPAGNAENNLDIR